MIWASNAESKAAATRAPVLVIFPGALGDLICVMPALRAIARATIRARDRTDGAGGTGAVRRRADRVVTRGIRSIGARSARLFSERVTQLAKPHQDSSARFDAIYSFFAADDADFRDALAIVGGGTREVVFRSVRPGRRPCRGRVSDANRLAKMPAHAIATANRA